MKLLDSFRKEIEGLGDVRRAWFTTFNLGIPFFETHVLPVLLGSDQPANRMDYETMQQQMADRKIDLRVFCDLRMMDADQLKRTAIPVHGILPSRLALNGFGKDSLFHPKVIFLEDESGKMVLGAGSANLTVSGWGRNQEAFAFRTVSNNEQYQQIKRFFDPLTKSLGQNEVQPLGLRRKFVGTDEDWRFAHSFHKRNFLQQLMAETEADKLTVWSPYLSRDLAGLVGRIQEATGRKLRFRIVPDRIGNRHLRTVWTEALGKLQEGGVLSFHDYPSPRADEIEMTHAKLWLASGSQARLAVGSWNCTEPGTASFEQRNVEAGILLNVPPATTMFGGQLELTKKDFSTEESLNDEELIAPPYPLPFDLQVRFDWESGRYDVDGQLFEPVKGRPYLLRLPGVIKPIPLCWKVIRRMGAYPLESIAREVIDNEALLANHCYEVSRDGIVEYRGLILETGQDHRRAQGYDSLKDLLNDLINDVDPRSGGTARLRKVLKHNDVPEEELASSTLNEEGGSVSYFRLFHAFAQFRKRLRATPSMDELEKILFVYPGSLQELVVKVNEQIGATGNTVFNWFLLEEMHSLRAVALDAYEQNRARYAPITPPKAKWGSLKPKKHAVSLPPEISGKSRYMAELREACDYER
ncbi:hypothetical protein [Paraburkholderia aspalathi]|uniref:PLD-like domain-containing protein n=1 Tax=Paraburkholderia aspalathi TaxID=1324617 RepID=A0A1I7CES9_9BURK|nr:hypothetical protein [Paraburkholderia aspalathi]MBK3844234.1 hypothetical protein [Paraburkholderia aspalathi]CAE6869545.1 hypothetical protein R69746_08317 [Paraburkholderia aspalathi]SFT97955.1 hypothetical protein SAMN05192563_1006178 [Paraburkholderia aspalathi]